MKPPKLKNHHTTQHQRANLSQPLSHRSSHTRLLQQRVIAHIRTDKKLFSLLINEHITLMH